MSFWKSLWSAPEVVDKTIDAAIATGDALVFTEEERSRVNMQQLEWVLKFHDASKGSNLARRLIGVMVMAVFLLLVIVTAGLIIGGLQSKADAIAALIADSLAVPVSVIIGFYFASGMLRDWAGKK